MHRLVKLGIDEELLQQAFEIMDLDGSGSLDKAEFTNMLFKMLHPPETQDLLAVQKRLDTLQRSIRVELKELVSELVTTTLDTR